MRLLRLLSFAVLALAASLAAAQKLDGPLKIVVGYSAGGGADRAARLVGEALHERLGVSVIVENKLGAGGRVAAQAFRTTSAAENALMLGNPSINVIAPLVYKDPGYDPVRDFVPVSQVASYGYGIAVGPLVPAKDIAQLVAWLGEHPRQANFGVSATGSLPHFLALQVADAAKVPAEVIAYRGSAPLVVDIVAGQLPIGVDTLESLAPQHDAGKLRVLASSGADRARELPGVATFKEQGFDVVASGWYTFFAAASMPADKVAFLGRTIAEIMATPEMQAKFRATAMDPVVATPGETARAIAAFRARWEPVIRAAKLEQ